MLKNFVAIDLETTGLDENAEIIEIGMVKIIEGEIIEKYEKLVKPVSPIPENITSLTGITNEMIANKPIWQEIEQEVLSFCGNNLLVAHNCNFDKAFLERAVGFKLTNLWLDTYEFAKIIIPNLPNYKLSYLTNFLNVNYLGFHRAVNDAEMAANILLKLIELAMKISPFTLEKIIKLFSSEVNGITLFLKSIQKEIITNYSFNEKIPIAKEETVYLDKLENLSFSQGECLLKPGGLLSLGIDNYEFRPQQLKMLNVVSEAFKTKSHAIIEASTGTGKSLAYLIPALLWSLENKCKVVIATNTIALQEQLFKKDIPLLEKCFNSKLPVSLLKGRNNYICLRRFSIIITEKDFLTWSEKVFISRIITWLDNTKTGDKEELNLNNYENEKWYLFASQTETCLGNKCSYYFDCYYYKIRKKVETSGLIITNHSLVLQDVKSDNKILPKHEYLIIDEAHNLEEEGIKQFAEVVDFIQLRKSCFLLTKGKSTGLLNKLRNLCTEEENISELIIETKEEVKIILTKTNEIIHFFSRKKDFTVLGEIRITRNERKTFWWKEICSLVRELVNYITSLCNKITRIINKFELIDRFEEIINELQFISKRLLLFKNTLDSFITGDDEEQVYWLEINNKNVAFVITPIKINQILRDKLFNTKVSVILTSATLAINYNLDHVAKTYGLEKDNEYLTLITDSPFNFQEQSLICIPTDLPDPSVISDDEYTRAITKSILNIIPAINGGILILFTSYYMLNNVYNSLKKESSLAAKEILAHGKDGNRINLVKALKTNPDGAIVLGTNSFWEGIDISGIGLTTVIIVKLPFAPPTRPVIAAKLEALEKQGENSFYKYSLPLAILKFRQGYGRLIRSNKDWGTLIILDNRILTKKYGKEFLKSIPLQPVFKGTTVYISHLLSKWMENKFSNYC
ncbi:MAG: ATP-dependent helicase DinG [Clostridia bacterium]|nr:ATP-dependent helicase DinG [Clostridia bacterium]